MTRGVACVAPEDDVREAARVMAEKKVRRLPVVNNGRVVGMLSLGDLARSKMFDMEASRALTDIFRKYKKDVGRNWCISRIVPAIICAEVHITTMDKKKRVFQASSRST